VRRCPYQIGRKGRENFGEKSFREVDEKPAVLGFALGMTPDDASYGAAIVAASMSAAKRTGVA